MARLPKWLIGALAFLALGYLVLLIPESHSSPRGAERQPFVWKQDAFWTELENHFNQARAAGCQSLHSQIATASSEVHTTLAQISSGSLPSEAPVFANLETGLFQLAPMVAACPEGLKDYTALITRIRSEIKAQSQHWDLKAPAVRQRLYRLLFGARMALEEVMLQAPASVEIPQIIPGADIASRTPAFAQKLRRDEPSASVGAITVHSGDILLSRGGAPTSALIARGNDFPGSFSHVALVHVDEQSNRAFVIESHIDRGVTVSPLEDYLADKKLRIVLLRLRPDLPQLIADPMLPHKAAASARAQAESRHIPYDFAMDYQRHDAQFCSEVVSAAYEPSGLHLWQGMTFISSATVAAWLGSLGVKHFETLEPADLEYDSQLGVVAEWRDLETLFKAHVDDVVTDVMLEEAKPGEPLPYQILMLPVTRLAKAYSFVLNLFGKVGPIPEGMSATTALRVKRFRSEHAALASQVLAASEEFKKTNGYTPPFWGLRNLAQQAARNRVNKSH